jgi:hypothetical protein
MKVRLILWALGCATGIYEVSKIDPSAHFPLLVTVSFGLFVSVLSVFIYAFLAAMIVTTFEWLSDQFSAARQARRNRHG